MKTAIKSLIITILIVTAYMAGCIIGMSQGETTKNITVNDVGVVITDVNKDTNVKVSNAGIMITDTDEITDIEASGEGVQVTYADGTGYWCEYDGNSTIQIR